jgi:hypothetical protein
MTTSSCEVIGVHGSDDLSTATSGSAGDGVVVSTAAGPRRAGGRLDEFKVNVILLRGHQAMIPQLARDCLDFLWVSRNAGTKRGRPAPWG